MHVLEEKRVGTEGPQSPPSGQFGLLSQLAVTGSHKEVAPEVVGEKSVGLMEVLKEQERRLK